MGLQDQENLKEAEEITLKEAEEITLKVSPSAEEGARTVDEWSDGASVGTALSKRYRVDFLIGNGATSSVYKGFDLQRKREIAVKILHRHLASDSTVVRRFEHEAETARIVTHPNIVAIHELNKTEQGQPYLVMDFVAGLSLQDVMSDCGGSLEWRRAIDICLQISAALRAAHEKGVVHRDMKPSNIMISKDLKGEDVVKVLDFGIAKVAPTEGDTFFKITQAGEMLGSLLYMSPEQLNGEIIDARSDVYSLGCVLYELSAGSPPISGRTAFETMNKHISAMPERLHRVRPNVEFPEELERVIFKAVAKKPSDRYQTIGDFQDDLLALSQGRCVGANYAAIDGGAATQNVSVDFADSELKTEDFFATLKFLLILYVSFLIAATGIAWCAGVGRGPATNPMLALLCALIATAPLPFYVVWKVVRGKAL